MKESDYSSLYKKFKRFSIGKIKDLLRDMQEEMEQVGERVTSEGFRKLDDSSNNLKQSVLAQVLEEKSSKK